MQSILATIEHRLDDVEGWGDDGIILEVIEEVLNEKLVPLLTRAEGALEDARHGSGFDHVQARHIEDELYDLRMGRD